MQVVISWNLVVFFTSARSTYNEKIQVGIRGNGTVRIKLKKKPKAERAGTAAMGDAPSPAPAPAAGGATIFTCSRIRLSGCLR